jgi:hypothetical protein
LGNRAEFVSFNLLNRSPELAEQLEKRLREIKASIAPFPQLKEFAVELDEKPTSKSQTVGILMKIAERVSKFDETTGSVENIIRRVSSAIEWIERTISYLQN